MIDLQCLQKRGLLTVLFLVLVIGFLFMPREEYPADPMAVRCETVSLLNTGSVAVPLAVGAAFGERGQFFVENTAKQQCFCKYGILNSVMYLPVLLFQKWHEGKLDYLSHSRVLYLNIFNILLSLLSAFYLYKIAARYTQKSWVIVLFVLSAVYTTCWWNYLRAHNSEIYQTLFMLGFYYHLVQTNDLWLSDAKKNQHGLVAGLFFSCMILVKIVYVVLLPLVGIFFFVHAWENSQEEESWQKRVSNALPVSICFGLPVVIAMSLVLWVNHYKFGSAFETGYGQWQERGKPIFSGNIFSGLKGFLVNPQYSIFICFPVFSFSLLGYPAFFKRHRLEMLFCVGVGMVLLLINSKFLAWSGGWSYGPRYMLVVLPLLSLPFIATLEILFQYRKKWWARCCTIIIAGSLFYSLCLQRNVNALPFFVTFELQGVCAELHDPDIDSYFANTPFGIINRDLLAFKQGASLRIVSLASKRLFPEQLAKLTKVIHSACSSNYYFFPDK